MLLEACRRVDLDAMAAALKQGVSPSSTCPGAGGRNAFHVVCGALECYTSVRGGGAGARTVVGGEELLGTLEEAPEDDRDDDGYVAS